MFSPTLSTKKFDDVINDMLSKKTIVIDVDMQWKENTRHGLQERGHANFLTVDYVKGTAYLIDSNGASLEKAVSYLNGFHESLRNRVDISPATHQRLTWLASDIEVH